MGLRGKKVREDDGYSDDEVGLVLYEFDEQVWLDDIAVEEFFEEELLEDLEFDEWSDVDGSFDDNDDSWYEDVPSLDVGIDDDELDDEIGGGGRRSWGAVRPWSRSRRSGRVGRPRRRGAVDVAPSPVEAEATIIRPDLVVPPMVRADLPLAGAPRRCARLWSRPSARAYR